MDFYRERGYIPSGLGLGKDCADKGGDNDCNHPASATLEYAAADASLALMAGGLGHRADARMFAARGQWYRNLWDSSIGQFRPRTTQGTWMTPYDPVEAGHQFHEGGAYQYQWLVPQDPAGLVELMGGRKAAEKRLDAFFVHDKLLTDPAGTARKDWISQPYDYYGKPTYNPNNEPDLHAPYMYLWAGAPAKTATVTRAAMTLFTNGPDGMTGNDDLGTMSAWYVFSSLGLYPTMSGADFLALSSPQFESATIRIGQYGRTQGGTLDITAPGASDDRRYVQSVALNGKDMRTTWLGWDAIAHGGRLAHRLGTEPSVLGHGQGRRTSVGQRRCRSRRAPAGRRVAAHRLGGRTDERQRAVRASRGGRAGPVAGRCARVRHGEGSRRLGGAGPSPVTLESRRLPVQTTVPLAVTVPAGTPVGSYPVRVTVEAKGIPAVVRTATVEVRPAVSCAGSGKDGCAVDLAGAWNHDGTATKEQSGQGNFDGLGWSYDADLLPKAGPVTFNGVSYHAPDPSGTSPNFVEARGQALLLPAGARSALHLVAASHNGPVTTTLTVRYTDGSSADVPVTIGDWAGSTPSGSSVVLDMPHRIKDGQGVDGPSVRLFGDTAALDSAKQVRSVALPDDPRVELYAITLT